MFHQRRAGPGVVLLRSSEACVALFWRHESALIPPSGTSRRRAGIEGIQPRRIAAMTTAYDFTATDIDGQPSSLDEHRGKVLLIVNVASQCGFTPQYTGLEKLWRDYGSRGFALLGFPCDQFGHQEPGDEAEIKSFCSLNYDVTFPLYAKIDVNGDA